MIRVSIADDPLSTGRFDRLMLAIYATLVAALLLISSAAWIYRDKLVS